MGATWRVAVVAALLALATACGSSDSGGDKVASLGGDKKGNAGNSENTNDGKTDDDKFREFAKCMRDQGVDMPDPDPNGGGVAMARPSNEDMEKMNKAGEVCNKLLPNGGKPKPLSPEELDKARAKAKCMREHGFDWPDPDPSGEMKSGTIQLDGDPAKTEKAFKECGMEMAGSTGGGK